MTQDIPDPLTVAKKTFEFIKSELPHLNMKIDEDPKNNRISAEMSIPKQDGLSFEINVIFAGDELTLVFSDFHWHFSCGDWEEQNWCIETVVRLVTNQARLKETFRGKRVVKSELQILKKGQWATDAVTGIWALPSFAKKTTRYIQNTSHQPK